jgi:biopolymer transport protein ExbD
MRRWNQGTGLEGAPDIMLLTMSALMVAIVWLVSHAHETTLPPIDLPSSDASRLGSADAAAVNVTLRPAAVGSIEVWLEDARVADDLAGLESALAAAGAGAVTLRADASTRWEDGLGAMSAAARLGLAVSVAAEP